MVNFKKEVKNEKDFREVVGRNKKIDL